MSDVFFKVDCPECDFYKDEDDFDQRMPTEHIKTELAQEAEAYPDYCTVSHTDIGVERETRTQ